MAQNGRSEGLACRPAGKRRHGNFSGRCSSGPKMASELLKTTVLRPFRTALQGSAIRVMFIKNRQRFTVSLPWASVLLVSKPSNLHTRGSIWASAGSAKCLQLTYPWPPWRISMPPRFTCPSRYAWRARFNRSSPALNTGDAYTPRHR